jgi:hypothetical protein
MPNLGGQRVGISAFQSLKIGVGARAVGMGESFVAVANDPSALYWNPAGCVEDSSNGVLIAHTEYVAEIRHDFLGATYHLTDADVIGCAVSSLHMADMEITTETQPYGTGRHFTFGDVGVGLTYARRMTDQFSFGATLRYVEETLDLLKIRSVMADLGTYYRTGLGSTRFAVVVTNFGSDVTPVGTVTMFSGERDSSFQTFSLPTVFKLGFALEPYQDADHRLTVSIQLNHPNDNAEHLRLGGEYAWREMFFVRGGLRRTIGQPLFGDDETSEEGLMAGAGVRLFLLGHAIAADYAFTDFRRLGAIHRISMAFTW